MGSSDHSYSIHTNKAQDYMACCFFIGANKKGCKKEWTETSKKYTIRVTG